MDLTLIQQIKLCANKLKDSKLNFKKEGNISKVLDSFASRMGLDSRDEAIMFTAIFERDCSGRRSDLNDMSEVFGCTVLDLMEYVPALNSLVRKGLIQPCNSQVCKIIEQLFSIPSLVMNSIIDNKVPVIECATEIISSFDRYSFCTKVDEAVQDSDVRTASLFQMTKELEDINKDMTFVRAVREIVPELADRVLFYEICHDFFDKGGRRSSDIDMTMNDIYESFSRRLSTRKSLMDGSCRLIAEDLVCVSEDRENMSLTEKGQRLLLEDEYASFGDTPECSNRYKFARMVAKFFHDSDKFDSESDKSEQQLKFGMLRMENANSHLPFVRKILDVIPEVENRVIFYFACNACPGGINLTRELKCLFPIQKALSSLNLFKDEKHELQKLDLVEIRSESSFFEEYTSLALTDKGKELFFEEDAKIFIQNIDRKDIISCGDIKSKRLFFSAEEQRQLSMVGSSLNEDNYRKLVERLESKGLSKGIAVLLYGAPGTGKTESVMQWAKESGRDIVHVDLSASKSMWYGESEKIVKDIFTRYRNQCKRSKVKPILLFNEADGLFSKRKDMSGGSSVDQTENTIQNILLEEMEKLDGILIATTNLEENLDAAFERRFLFKIHLEKPGTEAKKSIWRDKLPSLSEADATILASDYDFSGGEIDNIVRKATMQEVLYGGTPTTDSINELCSRERLSHGNNKRIGF